jgi:hypothetical protein
MNTQNTASTSPERLPPVVNPAWTLENGVYQAELAALQAQGQKIWLLDPWNRSLLPPTPVVPHITSVQISNGTKTTTAKLLIK